MNIFLDLLFWAITLDVVGKVILGVSVISVHWKIVKEHKVDAPVLKEMHREHTLAIIGIGLILIAYALELIVLYEIF
jgi:hypothetical protein